MTILIVEDDKDLRSLMVQNLRNENYEAESAGCVEEPLPSLLFLDLNMDGRTLLSTLNADPHFDRLPIVVMTLDVDFLLGAETVLHKPFTVDQMLYQAARHCCRKSLMLSH